MRLPPLSVHTHHETKPHHLREKDKAGFRLQREEAGAQARAPEGIAVSPSGATTPWSRQPHITGIPFLAFEQTADRVAGGKIAGGYPARRLTSP